MTIQSSIADTFTSGGLPDGAAGGTVSGASGSVAGGVAASAAGRVVAGAPSGLAGGAPGGVAGGAPGGVAGCAPGGAVAGAPDAADAVARADALLEAAAAVAGLGASSADYDALSDAAALAGQRTIAQAQHELDTRKAWMAKTLAHRSRWELGQAGLAKKQGFLSPEDLIQNLTGTTRAESRKLVGVGQMLGETEAADTLAAEAEAEAARRLLDDALTPDSPDAGGNGDNGGNGGMGETGDPTTTPPMPEPIPAPWHAPISHAVSDGTLSIDAAHALRTGLGDIDTVVTGPVLADALAGLLAEAPRLNADQLLKRARQTRDSLDADGIRTREQKAWDDRYLRIWALGTGQVRVDGLFPPEQGEFIKATFDGLTSPRRGGVRFVDTERANWARRVQNDPRTTTQITCDGFLDLLKAGTTVNPHEMLGGRRPAVQIITTATPTPRPTGPTTRAVAGPAAGPSTGPTAGPAAGPTYGPPARPKGEPIAGPTKRPAARPNGGPTAGPTAGPAAEPAAAPVIEPAGEATTGATAARPPARPDETVRDPGATGANAPGDVGDFSGPPDSPDRADSPPGETCRLDGLFPVEFLRDADDILICEPGRGGHGYLEGNTAPVSAETIERLICDSGSVDISFDDLGRPLDVGRDERLFTRAQRRALAARDGGCRWPGCDRPPAFTEAHHINHWLRDHGRTDVDQGILLCHAHHLLLHNQRWQIFEHTGQYWLRPPATVDPGQRLVEMPSHNRPRLT